MLVTKSIRKYLPVFLSISICWLSWSQDGSRGSGGTSTRTNDSGTTRALIIGISDYIQSDLKLDYADNDAVLFKEYLTQAEGLEEDNVRLLINEDAIALNIVQELKWLAAKSNAGDTVFIYFAGHGDVVDDFGKKAGFLLAADANANQEYYSGGVLPLALLNTTVLPNFTERDIKVVLILDACKSGFLFEDSTQTNLGTIASMFENTTRLLSCRPDELSYEGSTLQHGYFTYYLVKGLIGAADDNDDGQLNYREIDDYLFNNVTAEVSKNHKQDQTPVVRTQNERENFKVIKSQDNLISFENVKSEIKNTKALVSRGFLSNVEPNELVQRFSTAISKKQIYGRTLTGESTMMRHVNNDGRDGSTRNTVSKRNAASKSGNKQKTKNETYAPPNASGGTIIRSSENAYNVYKEALKDESISDAIKEKMQLTLLKELSSGPQKLINDYIQGNSNLPQGTEFYQQARNLKLCLEIMDSDSFLRDQVIVSQLLLEAYAIIRNKNFFEYRIAKKKLKDALELQPNAAYVHNALGEVYNAEEQFDSAYHHFNKARNLIGSWTQPVGKLGDNLLDQFKYDEAKQYLDEALGLKGSDQSALLKLGKVHENEGKYSEAESYYQQVLEMEPDHVLALQSMSHLQKLKGNTKVAKEWYDKALKSDYYSTLLNQGILNYIQENNLNERDAENLFLDVINYAPYYSSSYSQYADYIRINSRKLVRLQKAENLYQEAIKLNPYNSWAYAGRGWTLMAMRQRPKALASFEEGIEKNSFKPHPYHYYGEFLVSIKDLKNAESYYLQAIEKDPYYLPVYEKLVALYIDQKAYQKAIDQLQMQIDINPEAPDLYYLLGEVHFAKGEYSEAILAYKKAINLDASYAKGYANLGFSELQEDDFESAKEHYLLANEYDPFKNEKSKIAESFITMANSKLKFGTPEAAGDLFRIAYEIDPSVDGGIAYAQHLYLQADSKSAFELGVKLLDKNPKKAKKILILELMVKSSIDNSDIANSDQYYQEYVSVDESPDYLLAAIYYRFRGDEENARALMNRVNPNLLRSTKLRSIYSEGTLSKYVFGD